MKSDVTAAREQLEKLEKRGHGHCKEANGLRAIVSREAWKSPDDVPKKRVRRSKKERKR